MTRVRLLARSVGVAAPLLLLVSLALLGATGCDRAVDLNQIARMEDARNPGRDDLADAMLDPSGGIRARAARAAGRIASPRFVPPLIALLDDPDPHVLLEAAFALGEICLWFPETGPEVATALLTRLDSDSRVEDIRARAALYRALGRTRSPEAFHRVDRGLADRKPEVKAAALMALSDLEGSLPALRLIRLTLADPNPSVRWRAARLLWRCDDVRALDGLEAALADTSELVRRMGARSLGRVAPEYVDSAAALLVRRLAGQEWDADVQVSMISALGRLSHPDGVVTLHTYRNSVYPRVRLAVAGALARYRGTQVMQDAIHLSLDEYPQVRAAAASVLVAYDHPTARSRLAELCRDSVQVVCVAAIEGLGRALAHIPPEERERSRAEILARLEEPDPALRRAAVTALGDSRDARSEAYLLAAVHDRDRAVAAAAVRALGALASSGVIDDRAHAERLRGWYRPSAAAELKRAVVEMLARQPGISACDLAPMLRDPDFDVRTTAWRSIRSMSVESRVEQPCDLPPRELVYSMRRPMRTATPTPSIETLPTRARIITERGELHLTLMGREAPRTVAHFQRLVELGVYDDSKFRFAVPDSVARIEPGPGAGRIPPIRCEINPQTFDVGMVGMYAPARDAGSASFFLTLSPQPELDGIHTVFAQIVQGLDLLARLGPEDRILRVVIG